MTYTALPTGRFVPVRTTRPTPGPSGAMGVAFSLATKTHYHFETLAVNGSRIGEYALIRDTLVMTVTYVSDRRGFRPEIKERALKQGEEVLVMPEAVNVPDAPPVPVRPAAFGRRGRGLGRRFSTPIRKTPSRNRIVERQKHTTRRPCLLYTSTSPRDRG